MLMSYDDVMSPLDESLLHILDVTADLNCIKKLLTPPGRENKDRTGGFNSHHFKAELGNLRPFDAFMLAGF